MSYKVEYRKIPSSDGIHNLHTTIFIPDGEVKGLYQISHGMQEYIGRYEKFMGFLCDNGYVVFGHDHLGHGSTANSDDELGYFAKKDGDEIVVNDVNVVSKTIKADYPGKNLILMGHSMGSFIARLCAAKYPQDYKALIIMGTGGKNPVADIGIGLTKVIASIFGEKHYSDLVENIAFGSYNDKFEKNTRVDWLSVDKDNITKYLNDKYCTFRFTTSAMTDLIKLNKKSNLDKWYDDVVKSEMPILLISGSMDPVGNYGAGIKEIEEKLNKTGIKNLVTILYEGARHEILNDFCKEKVYSDILSFITTNI